MKKKIKYYLIAALSIVSAIFVSSELFAGVLIGTSIYSLYELTTTK
jgi:hypothetical protein